MYGFVISLVKEYHMLHVCLAIYQSFFVQVLKNAHEVGTYSLNSNILDRGAHTWYRPINLMIPGLNQLQRLHHSCKHSLIHEFIHNINDLPFFVLVGLVLIPHWKEKAFYQLTQCELYSDEIPHNHLQINTMYKITPKLKSPTKSPIKFKISPNIRMILVNFP